MGTMSEVIQKAEMSSQNKMEYQKRKYNKLWTFAQ